MFFMFCFFFDVFLWKWEKSFWDDEFQFLLSKSDVNVRVCISLL